MATYHLPSMLKGLREVAPGIEIEIVVSNEVRDLRRREADIAIRHFRPDQPDLIARFVAKTTAHLFASSEYLDRQGRPRTPADLSDADFVGPDQIERFLPEWNALGLPLTRDNFKVTTTSGTTVVELLRQGFGFALLPKDVARTAPELEQVLPEFEPIPMPIWLVTHRELHTNRGIRLVFDMLAEALSARLGSARVLGGSASDQA